MAKKKKRSARQRKVKTIKKLSRRTTVPPTRAHKTKRKRRVGRKSTKQILEEEGLN